jgi:hypothetical protein
LKIQQEPSRQKSNQDLGKSVDLKTYLFKNKIEPFLDLNKIGEKKQIDVSKRIQSLDHWYQVSLLGTKEFEKVVEYLSSNISISGLSDIYTCSFDTFKFLFHSEEDLFVQKIQWYNKMMDNITDIGIKKAGILPKSTNTYALRIEDKKGGLFGV